MADTVQTLTTGSYLVLEPGFGPNPGYRGWGPEPTCVTADPT
ncbi:hypothetical protein [Halomontanus rarus]|nr:hypothetical protein [Halovivax sp. TS33]